MTTILFTPRHAETGERLRMQISMLDYQLYKSISFGTAFISVYDTTTKKDYLVQSAKCGLKCRCDAVYKEA